jgi:hypothetical protein
MTPILGILDSAKYGALHAGNYYSIATATVTSGGQGTISFTSIPQGYSHLQIRWFVPSSTSSNNNIAMEVGGSSGVDTGNNYTLHELLGNGSTASAGALTGLSFARIGYFDSSGGTYPMVGVTDILDYANINKYKTIRTLSGHDDNGSGGVRLVSGLWSGGTIGNANNAIANINIYSANSITLPQNSVIALYGVK